MVGPALQVEGDRVQRPEHDQVGEQTAAARPRRGPGERGRGRASGDRARLPDQEPKPRTAQPASRPTTSATPCRRPSASDGDRREEGCNGGDEQAQDRPSRSRPPVCRWRLRGIRNQARTHAEDPHRDVDEEDEAPAAGGDQEAAHGGAERQTEGLGRALDADARPSFSGGMARAMMATLLACSIAAPTACRTRKPSRAARLGASPQSAEPTMKTHEPVGVEELAPDHVGEAADRGDQRHQHHAGSSGRPRSPTPRWHGRRCAGSGRRP